MESIVKRSPLQLPCHIHQLQFDYDAFEQILEFFMGVVQSGRIAFAEVGIADEAGEDGLRH